MFRSYCRRFKQVKEKLIQQHKQMDWYQSVATNLCHVVDYGRCVEMMARVESVNTLEGIANDRYIFQHIDLTQLDFRIDDKVFTYHKVFMNFICTFHHTSIVLCFIY